MVLIGNCVKGWESVAMDATDLDRLISDSKKLTFKEFKTLTGDSNLNTERFGGEYGYNEKRKVAWSYNKISDIHYFFI